MLIPMSGCYSTRDTAKLVGRPVQTLYQARCAGPSRSASDMPPHVDYGHRRIVYRLDDLLAWSARTGRPLHFDALPTPLRVPL